MVGVSIFDTPKALRKDELISLGPVEHAAAKVELVVNIQTV